MNIHLPAILGFTRYQGFDPSPYNYHEFPHSKLEDLDSQLPTAVVISLEVTKSNFNPACLPDAIRIRGSELGRLGPASACVVRTKKPKFFQVFEASVKSSNWGEFQYIST